MNTLRKALFSAGLVGSTLVGGALGAAMLNGTANAAESTTSTAPAATTPAAGTPAAGAPAPGRHGGPGGGSFDPSKGGHVGSNGVTETLLTGDTAEKVKAAALAAVPGTIERVENDAEGSPYEAHMTKSDGSRVTVKVDSNFSVTNIENG